MRTVTLTSSTSRIKFTFLVRLQTDLSGHGKRVKLTPLAVFFYRAEVKEPDLSNSR